jgi:hypothetical protein
MFGRRKALIGYLAFWAGRRVTERVVRRELRKRLAVWIEPEPPKRRRRRLPLIGAALALAAAGAVVVSRLRG